MDPLLQKIISKVLKGNIPCWQKPCKTLVTKNLLSKKIYYLKNIEDRFQSPWYITEKQLKNIGGKVKKGRGGFITYSGNQYIEVFNIEQCADIIKPEIPKIKEIIRCNKIIKNYLRDKKITLQKSLNLIGYLNDSSVVCLPPISSFKSIELYHFGKFHELIHSTEHKDRLNRFILKTKTIEGLVSTKSMTLYAEEELIADLGACILSERTGILNSVIDYSISYLNMFINKYLYGERLGKNKENKIKLLKRAYTKALEAVEYIINN